MNNEPVAGMIIMLLCCWGCALVFMFIGFSAFRMEKPMHFWSGSHIEPGTISNIPAYNRANGIMWICYSIPYWMAGFLMIAGAGSDQAALASVVCLVLATFPGIPILIGQYRRILQRYSARREDNR